MAKRLRADSTSPTKDAVSTQSPQSVEPIVHNPKYAELDIPKATSTSMRCFLPPHKPMSFTTYVEYETHYNQAHSNRCAECKKNLPTAHVLDLHIAENHDPIVAFKRDAGEKTYACFVEGCEKVCVDWKKRRSHLVDKHAFPKNYDFFVVKDGIDGRRSMLRRGIDAQGHRKSSRERRVTSSVTEATQSTEVTSVSRQTSNNVEVMSPATSNESDQAPANAAYSSPKPDIASSDMDEITTSLLALKMVPRSVTFGKRKGRAGFAKS